jgi:hypothetical protein
VYEEHDEPDEEDAMRRVLMVGCTVALAALVAPAGAGAAGGPVPALQGAPGVSVPGGSAGYVAVGAGDSTLVKQVLEPDGATGRTRTILGRYGVPGVAFDNSTTGLSADGRTLVLAEIPARFPVRATRLAVFDARRVRLVRNIVLAGYFTVDAIAPDGRMLYLIRYLRQDGTRYEVRAYDLARNRLVPAPVVDPREPGEKMQGVPITRTMGDGGRVAYTLYMRPGGEPFIHALDTVAGRAACIDLPGLSNADLSGARLTPPAGGRPLLVTVPRLPALAVDVAARRARTVPPARPVAPAAPVASAGGSGAGGLPAWLGALVATAALGAGLAAAARRRHRRRSDERGAMPA